MCRCVWDQKVSQGLKRRLIERERGGDTNINGGSVAESSAQQDSCHSKGLRSDEPDLHEAQTEQIPCAVVQDGLIIFGDNVGGPKHHRHEVDHEIS